MLIAGVACDRGLSDGTGGNGGGGVGGFGGHHEGAGAGGAAGFQACPAPGGAGGHHTCDGGPDGVGGASPDAGTGGYCGTGCAPTYSPPVDTGQFPACGPSDPMPGHAACVAACGPYRAVRWKDDADTYACYYDQAGNLVSGRVMGSCFDPSSFGSGPDVVCPGDDGGDGAVDAPAN